MYLKNFWFIRHLSDGLLIFYSNLWNLSSDIWALPSEMSDDFHEHCYLPWADRCKLYHNSSVQFSSVHILEAGPCGPLFPDPMWLVVAVYMLVLLVPTGLLMVYCNWKHDYPSVIGIFWECYLNNIQYSSLIMNSFRFSGVSIPRVPTLGYMGNVTTSSCFPRWPADLG